MKFSEMVYERPDIGTLKKQLTELIGRLKKAESY